MTFSEIIQKIDSNQEKIASYGNFDKSILNKINYKLRLDWNYHSNRMEGGTLTQEETRSVMIGNIDVKGKPFKDVSEMNGHDKIVLEVLKLSKGESRLSEKRIKDIHKAIMYEENTENQHLIGSWKKHSNEIINYQNERFEFVAPNDVPEKIHGLLNKINAYLDKILTEKKLSIHPLEEISQFHIDYLTIHPFYDGNGRTARILTNILLMVCGYPVIIIKENVKKNYYKLLADIQVYGGKPDLFYVFIGERILETQQIILNALEGKSIDEEDDLDKKIAMLERELNVIDENEEVKVHFNSNYFENVLNTWISDLLNKLIPNIQKFNKFFKLINHQITMSDGGIVMFDNEPFDEIISKTKLEHLIHFSRFTFQEKKIRIIAQYNSFIKGGLNTFDCNFSLEINFDSIKYQIFIDEFNEKDLPNKKLVFENLLHKSLTEENINEIINRLCNSIYEHINFHSKKNGLR